MNIDPKKSGELLVVVTPGKNVHPGEYTFVVTASYDDSVTPTGPTEYEKRFFTVTVQ